MDSIEEQMVEEALRASRLEQAMGTSLHEVLTESLPASSSSAGLADDPGSVDDMARASAAAVP
eukprot:3308330-Alexandrium_andersonii.AAC.1